MDKKDHPDRDKLANALTRIDDQPVAPPAMAPKPDQHKMDKSDKMSDKMAMTQVDAMQKPEPAPAPRPAPVIGAPAHPSPVGGQFNISPSPQAAPAEPPARFTVSEAPRTVWVGGGGVQTPAAAPAPDAPTAGSGARPAAQPGAVFDPVVGWLVVISGPGKGNSRPVHNGNNAIGRSPRQRIPLDFGDDAISSEEQAYLRYDPSDRTFLFVPNLAKANLVSVNDKKPTSALQLNAGDVIGMGRTKLLFAPLCGPHFDWSDQDGKM